MFLVNTPHQLCDRHLKARRDSLDCAQAGLLLARLNVMHERLSQTAVDGEIRQAPVASLPQPAHTLAKPHTDVR